MGNEDGVNVRRLDVSHCQQVKQSGKAHTAIYQNTMRSFAVLTAGLNQRGISRTAAA
jgi:hypothetical protein